MHPTNSGPLLQSWLQLGAYLLGLHGLDSSRYHVPRVDAPQTISLFSSSSRPSRRSSPSRLSCGCIGLCYVGSGSRLGCCSCLGRLLRHQRQLETFVGGVVRQNAALYHCTAGGREDVFEAS